MRFYAAIRIAPEKHLEEICENPYLVFCTDFMYYLASLQAVDWRPIKIGAVNNSYSPHTLSPCTINVKKAMQYNLSKSLFSYELHYNELVPDMADNKLEIFIVRIRNALDNLNDIPLKTFFTLLHVGRCTIQFYKYGTKDAAHMAPYLMAHALKRVVENSKISDWFNSFDLAIHDLVHLYKNGFSDGLYDEYFPYYEDMNVNADFELSELNEDELSEISKCGKGEFDEDACGKGEFDEDACGKDEFDEDKCGEGKFDEDELDENELDEGESDYGSIYGSVSCACGYCDDYYEDSEGGADLSD